MKRHIILYLLFVSFKLWSQPINDNCSGIIELGVVPVCSPTDIFTNVNATESDIGNDNFPNCFDENPERDVWFSFVPTSTLSDYTISVIGCPDSDTGDPAISNPQIALYRGDLCAFDELDLIACTSAADGENSLEFAPPALTPGITYYLRINDWSVSGTPNWGAFKLCIEEFPQIFTIDQGGSNRCKGTIFDSGGADGDYSNNENNVFTICPDEPNSCLHFSVEYYNLESADQFDQLVIYDGATVNADLLGTVPYYNPAAAQISNSTGGNCYSTVASSGCITLQFLSDGQGVAEGFRGSWWCSSEVCKIPEPISVTTDASNQDILDNISSPQATISVTNVDCDSNQFGIFESSIDSDLGMEKGLIMTTGAAMDAIGPNQLNSISTDWGNPGDDDLDTLGFPNLTFDACVIELDVYVTTDELSFEYIFASEEYPERINQATNDAFAFLISGPGISGNPSIGGQENIAIIPGTNEEVSINNINHTNNWEYFRYNRIVGDISPQIGKSIEYDGMTSDFLGQKKSLTASRDVTPCNTYHLKLVVADKDDSSFDSGIFLSEISGGKPNLEIAFFNGLNYLVEDCTLLPDEITFSLPLADMDEATTFTVVIGGTATQGEDYSLDIPSTLVFDPGETELTFPIMALSDGVAEGPESIEIKLINDFGCGEVVYATLNFEIQDNPEVEILHDLDTLFLCPGFSTSLEADGANQYSWSPQNIFDNHLIKNPEAAPTESTWLFVEGSIGLCENLDSIWVEVVQPEVNIDLIGNDSICIGQSVTLTANNNVNNSNMNWFPGSSLDDSTAVQIVVSPTITTTYSASVSLDNCGAAEHITINVESFDFPELTTTDTTICPQEGFQLAEELGVTGTTYNWSPQVGLDPNSMVSGPFVMPPTNLVYTLTATSPNGVCSETATVTIEVLHFNPNLAVSGTLGLCEGEETTLTATTSSAEPTYSWVLNGNTISQEASITVMPSESTTYQVIALDQENHCFYDEVEVEVIVTPSFEIEETLILDQAGNPLGLSPNLLPGDNISLEVITNPSMINGASYEWSIEGEAPFLVTTTNTTGLITIPSVSGNENFNYQVTIIAENDCADEAFINVNVNEGNALIDLPNVFTPDGDGLNDLFQFTNSAGIIIQQFKVYNRWGKIVHDGGESWDGFYEGEPAPSDVYIYHIIYQNSAVSESVELKGDLTLIR